jgi:hypothetical protein
MALGIHGIHVTLGRPMDSINLSDLESLSRKAIVESRFIEYEREVSLREASDTMQLLKAVTSFASSAGVDLLIGV